MALDPSNLQKGIADRQFNGGRVYPSTDERTVNTADLSEAPTRKEVSVYGQQSESISGGEVFQFNQNGAVWYPDDLGSPSNAHYVKFEVYLLDTEKSIQKVRGDSKKEVGFDKDAKPRFTQSLSTYSGHTRNTSVVGTPQMKKLNEVIALPMPEGLTTDHSTMWSRSEGGMISSVTALGDGVMTNGLGEGGSAIAKTAALGAANGIAGLLAQMDLDGAQTHLKLLTKRVPNPRNEFLFDGVNNRSFNFQWTFFPKSEREARQLKIILEKMKLYMYPELDQSTSGNFYLFPAMFDITFMRGAKENEWLYRTSTCALTNMIVNYSGAGMWSSSGDDGAPTSYNVTMQFTEAEFLHRDRFKNETNPEGVAR